jgi:hypothetical protein
VMNHLKKKRILISTFFCYFIFHFITIYYTCNNQYSSYGTGIPFNYHVTVHKARCVSILENKTNVSVNKSSSSSFSFLVMCAKVSPNHFDVFWSVIRVVF